MQVGHKESLQVVHQVPTIITLRKQGFQEEFHQGEKPPRNKVVVLKAVRCAQHGGNPRPDHSNEKPNNSKACVEKDELLSRLNMHLTSLALTGRRTLSLCHGREVS